MLTPAPTRPLLRYHGGKWLLAPWIIGVLKQVAEDSMSRKVYIGDEAF